MVLIKVIDPNLLIQDGQLVHKDGIDVQQYLRDFQRDRGVPDGSFVFIVDAARLNKIVEDANNWRTYGFCLAA